MTQLEALALVQRMRDLVGEHPGARYQSSEQLDRIAFSLGGVGKTTYFDEKVSAAIEYARIWCSPRKWQQYGPDPARLRANVQNSLYQLESVIRQELPPPTTVPKAE